MMHRPQHRRRLVARWLLAIFMPMLMMASVHTHAPLPQDDAPCEACVNHMAHAGHISAPVTGTYECLFCQFLSLGFMGALTVCVRLCPRRAMVLRPRACVVLSVQSTGHAPGRAPPAGF